VGGGQAETKKMGGADPKLRGANPPEPEYCVRDRGECKQADAKRSRTVGTSVLSRREKGCAKRGQRALAASLCPARLASPYPACATLSIAVATGILRGPYLRAFHHKLTFPYSALFCKMSINISKAECSEAIMRGLSTGGRGALKNPSGCPLYWPLYEMRSGLSTRCHRGFP
jgi:hypothetical protein